MDSKVLAVLLIRSGSKRLVNKNIRTVGYYPLFYHSIITCLKIELIDLIVVSVDSEEYKKIVESYFHDNPRVLILLRPIELATDESKSEDAIIHAIKFVEKNLKKYDFTVLVQATNPLTRSSDILNGLKLLSSDSNLNSVFSVSSSKRFYLDDMNTLIERPRTQDKKAKVYEVGCFWCFKTDDFMSEKNRIIEPYGFIEVSEWDAIDIDTEEDFSIVDMLLSKRVREVEQRYFEHIPRISHSFNDKYYLDKQDPDGNVRNILFEKQNRIDFAENEVKYINSLIKVKQKNKLKFLSIGCGAGYAESTLLDSFEKYGVEPDYQAYKISRDVFDFMEHGVFDSNKYKQSFFDVIFCHHVIEHVEDPVSFIRDIGYILKPGGKLIIGTPNFDSAMARKYGDNFRMLHDNTHISLFSDFSLKELLEDNMFLVNHIDYPYFETKYFNEKELMNLLSNQEVSPPFYGSIFTIYAEKK